MIERKDEKMPMGETCRTEVAVGSEARRADIEKPGARGLDTPAAKTEVAFSVFPAEGGV